VNILLVGNPNVGKSVIFNSLTGQYVTVSNYPGTTVAVSRGVGKFGGNKFSVIDTPGVNSLTPSSEDEKVTSEILSKSNIACVVNVIDAKNLKRSLGLTLELLQLKIPLVIDLNMADEAMDRGIEIDVKRLAEKLGAEVVETVATTGMGMHRLKEAIIRSVLPAPKIDLTDYMAKHIKTPRGLLLHKSRFLDSITTDIISPPKKLKQNISGFIARITTRPLTGIPILMLVLAVLYLFVGKFAAGTLVDFMENELFGKNVNPFIITLVNNHIPLSIVREFLIGDYGLITMAMTYAFAIIFPIVTAFFLFFGVLEDSGYLPRLSVLSDKVFRVVGLNGRAILPMVLGLGCGTMATLTARILDTKKERILTTLLLTLAIPCSAQLGVIMGILGSMSAKAMGLWLLIIISVMVIVGFGASKVIPGKRSPFIQELPPIRMPQFKNILRKTVARLGWYLKEAVPLFILGTAVLFFLDKSGILDKIEKLLNPFVINFLNLPSKVTEAFIIGFFRRDYGAAGLFVLSKSGQLDKIQILVSLVVITLFVPCVAQFFVTVKERGMKVAVLIGAFVFTFAFFAGCVLNFALRHLAMRGINII